MKAAVKAAVARPDGGRSVVILTLAERKLQGGGLARKEKRWRGDWGIGDGEHPALDAVALLAQVRAS